MSSNFIVCEAEPFCYGPAATLASLIPWLHELGHVIVLASGTSLELLREVPTIQVIALDDNPRVQASQYAASLERAAMAVGVLGNGLLAEAVRVGVPTAYIDVLFWLWPQASNLIARSADYYFIEDHFNAAQHLDAYRAALRNPILVPPILDPSLLQFRSCRNSGHIRGGQLLVTFGGVDSKFTHDAERDTYLRLLTASVLAAVDDSHEFSRIMFTGGGRAMATIRSLLSSCDLPARAVSLGHAEYLRELRGSKMLLAHPGLLTPLEAFSCGIPVAFLPPMNYTQLVQLRRFRTLGVAPYALEWETLCSAAQVREDLPEEAGVQAVQQMIRTFAASAAAQASLLASLRTLLATNSTRLNEVATQQRSSENARPSGGEVVADILHTHFTSKREPAATPALRP